MGRITFTQATEFLAHQLQSGNNFRRVGIVVRASLDNVVDATKRLDDLVQTAWDKLDAAMDRKLADFTDENQRNAMRLSYAGSLRVPVAEQLHMLDVGRHAESVTSAAAKQTPCPVEVQRFLAKECSGHRMTMVALAQKHDADIQALELLASHPDRDVRLTLAANLGGRMRLSEPQLTESKLAVYNALLNHYESDFAPHLVPVCRDEDQLAQMYAQTSKTPSNGRLFVDNPYTPDQVLLDISTSMPLRMMPGGSAVASEAKQQVEKRLSVRSDAAPEPY